MPLAGDDFVVIESESRAREVTDFRQRRRRATSSRVRARGTLEQMFSKIAAGETKELPVVVKADVQGSLEAIVGSLQKMRTDEVGARILHAGGRRDQRKRRDPRQGDRRRHHRLQCPGQPAGARPGAARRRRNPLLRDHLRCHRRHAQCAVGHAVADPARAVPRQRRDPRGLQHHPGRQGRRLHGHRRRGQARRQGAPAARQRRHPRRRR